MAYGYGYGFPGYYAPPIPDQLSQLRGSQYQSPAIGQMQPTMNNTPSAQPMSQPVSQPTTNNMIWVQGEAGAKSFLVAPGNTVPLWDSENRTVYVKTVDASGIPSMRIFDYVERVSDEKNAPQFDKAQNEHYVTRNEFDELRGKYEYLAEKYDILSSSQSISVKSTSKKSSNKEEE